MDYILENDTLADNLTKNEHDKIVKLLKQRNNNIKTDLEQIWYLMDLAWDYYGCDNKNLDWSKINKFYSDEVWLLNGLFIEQDNDSMGHRKAISKWIIKQNLSNIIDYGGGFGTLPRLIATKNSKVKIDIYEPYNSNFGLRVTNSFKNIRFINNISKDYNCLISLDVLEHVDDPLATFEKMIHCVKLEGYLVIANAFFPMIKCHLPKHFHFRYTFDIFARIMGLRVISPLTGSHATIYQKTINKKLNWNKIRFLERISKLLFLLINTMIKLIIKLIPKKISRFIYHKIYKKLLG